MHEYQLRYLPQFHLDLKEHALYIASSLMNPKVAEDLIDAAEKAILERLPVAEAFEPFHSRKERRFPLLSHLCEKFYYLLCCPFSVRTENHGSAPDSVQQKQLEKRHLSSEGFRF